MHGEDRPGASGGGQRQPPAWVVTTISLVVVACAATLVGVTYHQQESAQAQPERPRPRFTPTTADRDPAMRIPEVRRDEYPSRARVDRDRQVAYRHRPAMGGPHDAAWAACNGAIYDRPVREEIMVHSLEHGAVWIAYDPAQVQDAELDVLRDRVRGRPYLMLSPYPDLDRPMSLQAWGHQLTVSDPADPRIEQFVRALRLNPYMTPNPGATCEPPNAGFDRAHPPPFDPSPPPPDAVALDGTGVDSPRGRPQPAGTPGPAPADQSGR